MKYGFVGEGESTNEINLKPGKQAALPAPYRTCSGTGVKRVACSLKRPFLSLKFIHVGLGERKARKQHLKGDSHGNSKGWTILNLARFRFGIEAKRSPNRGRENPLDSLLRS